MEDEVVSPHDYVATYCRNGHHADCQAHRMVMCACRCHGPKSAPVSRYERLRLAAQLLCEESAQLRNQAAFIRRQRSSSARASTTAEIRRAGETGF